METPKRKNYVRPAKLYAHLTSVNNQFLMERLDWHTVYVQGIRAWQQNIGEGRLPEWVYCNNPYGPYDVRIGTQFYATVWIIDNDTKYRMLVTERGTFTEAPYDDPEDYDALDPEDDFFDWKNASGEER